MSDLQTRLASLPTRALAVEFCGALFPNLALMKTLSGVEYCTICERGTSTVELQKDDDGWARCPKCGDVARFLSEKEIEDEQ